MNTVEIVFYFMFLLSGLVITAHKYDIERYPPPWSSEESKEVDAKHLMGPCAELNERVSIHYLTMVLVLHNGTSTVPAGSDADADSKNRHRQIRLRQIGVHSERLFAFAGFSRKGENYLLQCSQENSSL
jgi:hypothetical protein